MISFKPLILDIVRGSLLAIERWCLLHRSSGDKSLGYQHTKLSDDLYRLAQKST